MKKPKTIVSRLAGYIWIVEIVLTPHVEDVDQRDSPLQDGSFVVLVLVAHNAEGDGQSELNEDERELDPEACA